MTFAIQISEYKNREAGNRKGDSMITAEGIVVPADWDENGNVIAVAISTYEEDEYIIDSENEKGRELLRVMRQKISVTGMIKPGTNDRKMITVEDYMIKEH